MRAVKITRPNGQIFYIVDDQAGSQDYYRELNDPLGRPYAILVDPADRANTSQILSLLNEIAFGDATVENQPVA